MNFSSLWCVWGRTGREGRTHRVSQDCGYAQLQVTLITPGSSTAIPGEKIKCDQINKNRSVRQMTLFCTASPFADPGTVLCTRDGLRN